jgi:hypothetical protein
VQEEQQAATQAQHARQEMKTRMRTQRRTPKEPEAIIIPHDVTVLKLAQLFGKFFLVFFFSFLFLLVFLALRKEFFYIK